MELSNKNLIIVRIQGGLGNQMFQYALALVLARKHKATLKIHHVTYDTVEERPLVLQNFIENLKVASSSEVESLMFRHKNSLSNRMLNKIMRKKRVFSKNYFKELSSKYDEKIFDMKLPLYIDGYWQNEKYFKNHKNSILEKFKNYEKLSVNAQRNKDLIEKDAQSVAIHIRRGDYVNNKTASDFHGVLGAQYYNEALAIIQSFVEGTRLYVFSDDVQWVHRNFTFLNEAVFISKADNLFDFEEMLLMSICKHNIIANSTFSWWSAWLNTNKSKVVVAPKQWYAQKKLNDEVDIIPERWIKI